MANGLARLSGSPVGVKISERNLDALTALIELEGELDLYAAAEVNASLARAIEMQQCLHLVVDLRRVESIDFSMIALLVQSGRALSARHGTLEVLCHDDEIGRLLSQAGGSDRFEVRLSEPGPVGN